MISKSNIDIDFCFALFNFHMHRYCFHLYLCIKISALKIFHTIGRRIKCLHILLLVLEEGNGFTATTNKYTPFVVERALNRLHTKCLTFQQLAKPKLWKKVPLIDCNWCLCMH